MYGFRREPVAIVAAIRLSLLAAIAFGLSLTDLQLVASMAALEAVLGLFTRTQVAPVPVVEAALKLPTGSTVADAVVKAKEDA